MAAILLDVDGVLHVSVNLETADEQVFDLYSDEGAGDNVPVVVQVGAWEEPVFSALPQEIGPGIEKIMEG